MFDGFYVANETDLRNRRGIVYVLQFRSGHWYCGSTSQSFRLRYGTLDLQKSFLLTNDLVKEYVAKEPYTVWLHCMSFGDNKERLAKEYSVIGNEYLVNTFCLNKAGKESNLGKRRKVELRSPNGAIVEFESVGDAQRHIGAKTHTQISALLNGRFRSSLGWTLPSYNGKRGHDLKKKPCVLVNPAGNEVKFNSQAEAAQAIGVRSIVELVSGKSTTIKGWSLPGRPKRKYLPVSLLSPNGEIKTFPSRLAASVEIGCSNQAVSSLCLGKKDQVKGWTLAEPCLNRKGN